MTLELATEHTAQSGDPNSYNYSSAGTFFYCNRQKQEEAPREKGLCCNSSQKGRVFLSCNLDVYLVVLITSVGTRFSSFR